MKKNNKLILSFLRPFSVALVLSLSVPVIASAEGSHSGDGGTSGSTIKTFASTSTDESSPGSTTTTDRSLSETSSHDLAEQFKKQGSDSNTSDRANRPAKPEEFRQKACTARKTEITKRMANAVRHATKLKSKMDSIYAKVKKFHDDKGLTTANYDTLVANVDTAGANVDANILALKALNTDGIDCTKTNVADALSAFRAALKSTRSSLKDYRTAIVALTKAVHQSADTSSGDSTQSNTNSQ